MNWTWNIVLTVSTLSDTHGGAFPVQEVPVVLGGLAVAAGLGTQRQQRTRRVM